MKPAGSGTAAEHQAARHDFGAALGPFPCRTPAAGPAGPHAESPAAPTPQQGRAPHARPRAGEAAAPPEGSPRFRHSLRREGSSSRLRAASPRGRLRPPRSRQHARSSTPSIAAAWHDTTRHGTARLGPARRPAAPLRAGGPAAQSPAPGRAEQRPHPAEGGRGAGRRRAEGPQGSPASGRWGRLGGRNGWEPRVPHEQSCACPAYKLSAGSLPALRLTCPRKPCGTRAGNH